MLADPGDTTWVQAYTWEAQNNPETAYDSPGRRWFLQWRGHELPEDFDVPPFEVFRRWHCGQSGISMWRVGS